MKSMPKKETKDSAKVQYERGSDIARNLMVF